MMSQSKELRLDNSVFAPLEKRSITLSRHRTSLALEPIFWELLAAAALRQNLSLAAFIEFIDSRRLQAGEGARKNPPNLASALRTYITADLVQSRAFQRES